MHLGRLAQEGETSPGAGCALAAAPRRGSALPASILTIIYHMSIGGELYHDLGPDHFDRRAKTVQTRRLLTRLQTLAYSVQITPLAA